MARLALSFKGQKLKIFALKEAETVIGRDGSCAICIDSLAIEPQHATVRQNEDAFSIEPVNAETVVFVNDTRIETAHELADGDLIQIGKHTLTYSVEFEQIAQETPEPSETATYPDAHDWLQIQSGSHLGRIIRLDKAFTRIGSAESHLAVIAHRDNGYYLSHLNGEQTPAVNDQEIGDSTHMLCNEDCIRVGELRVQFFSDTKYTRQGDNDMDETSNQPEQRKFTRIPFDVSVSLPFGDEHW